MKNHELKWNNWVGPNYPKMKNRILILGQNPYAWPEDKGNKIINSPDFVKRLVKEHGLYFTNEWGGIENSKFFRPIERLFFNKKYPTQDEIKKLWNSVAFNQFIQDYGENAQDKMCERDFRKAWKNVPKIINELEEKPTLIILLGNSAFNHLPNSSDFKIADIEWYSKIGRSYPKKGIFKTENLSIPIIAVQHPSHHFSWSKWHEFIKPYIQDYLDELSRMD